MFPAPFPFTFGSGRLSVVILTESGELIISTDAASLKRGQMLESALAEMMASILPARLRFAATVSVSEPGTVLFESQQPILKVGKKLTTTMYEQIFETAPANVRRGIRLSPTSAMLDYAFDPVILKRGLKLISDIAQITVQYLECLVFTAKRGLIPTLTANLEITGAQTQIKRGCRLRSFTEPITFSIETPYLKIPVTISARLAELDLSTGLATVRVGILCPTSTHELTLTVNTAALRAGSRLETSSGAFDVAGYVAHLAYTIMGHFVELLSKIKDPIELESKIKELITLKSVITRLKEG